MAASPGAAPIIQLERITRVYRSGALAVRALRGVDLVVERGEFLAIMGASGSGKSTLMNVLGCLDRPTAGRYLLGGEDVATLSRDRLAGLRNRTIGFVFQGFHLLPRTSALENVELPLLYAAEAPSWAEMRERARALVTRPALLLADEPTGNLDSRTTLEIIDILQQLNEQGLTILMVTHEPEIARAAKRTITLRDGLIRSDRRTEPFSAAETLATLPEEDADELELLEEVTP